MDNKKITLLFILTATTALLGIVGFTVAYFTSSVDFDNEFTTGKYETTATETFTSPEGWLPGDTTPKTLTIENTGNVDVKARVCFDERWVSSSSLILDNEVNGERVAIINLANTSDWTKQGDCFIYNDTLEPNDTTGSFIESVTFNPNIEAELNCTTTTNNGTTTKRCTSAGYGYNNATYYLTFTVDTIQASAYNDLWGDKTIYTTSNEIVFLNKGLPNELVYDTTASAAMQRWITDIGKEDIQPYYIKHIIRRGVVYETYIGFVISNEMASSNPGFVAGQYEIKCDTEDETVMAQNKSILLGAFASSNCTIYSGNNIRCRVSDGSRFSVGSSLNNIGADILYSTGCSYDNFDKASYCYVD